MMVGLICLIRRHQWHNGWDEDRHQTLCTCQRCGKTKLGKEDPGNAINLYGGLT